MIIDLFKSIYGQIPGVCEQDRFSQLFQSYHWL